MTFPHPILYTFRRCPYAMRARMGIYASGMKVHLREIVLRDKPDHMLEISPKGTVPVLMLTNGDVIEESIDILKHALSQNDPHGLLDCDKDLADSLIKTNDNDFKYALDRYKYPNRYPDEDCTKMRERGEEFLKQINDLLQNQKFLCGETISYADIAIFPFIRQFAHVDKGWFYARPYPNLQRWLKERLDSDLFKAIMEKFKPWNETGEIITWPHDN